MEHLSEREWLVLSALWDSGGDTLGGLTDALRAKTGWNSNSTVLTYLTRMEAKGLVTIDKGRYPHVYRAAVDRDACQARERETFLQRVYGGAAGDLVAAFLKESHISAQEREELRKLLDEMEV